MSIEYDKVAMIDYLPWGCLIMLYVGEKGQIDLKLWC